MKIINKILNWFLLSSQNPKEASLTFKGVLIGIIPLALGLLQLTNITVSSAEVNTFISQSAVGLKDILYVVASLVTAYGAIRKVYLTVKSKQETQMLGSTVVGSTVNQVFGSSARVIRKNVPGTDSNLISNDPTNNASNNGI